jgi:hypothetical protein
LFFASTELSLDYGWLVEWALSASESVVDSLIKQI